MVSCVHFFYTYFMSFSLNTYLARNSYVHRFDPRIKLILLLVFSVAVFMVTTWIGLGIFALVLAIVLTASRLPVKQIAKLCIPLLVILFIIWVCNALTFDVHADATLQSFGAVSVGFAAGMPNIALVGVFGFSPEGAVRGAFYVVRIVLLFVASFVVVLSTTSNELVNACISLLRPLEKIRVPIDDVAMVFSLALRFIPLIAEEASQIKKAQMARGAAFGQGGIWKRITAWFPVLVPLIVGLFKKAERISVAMDSRCYGKGKRTALVIYNLTVSSVSILVISLCFFIVVAWLL